jgi:hypothetical protein
MRRRILILALVLGAALIAALVWPREAAGPAPEAVEEAADARRGAYDAPDARGGAAKRPWVRADAGPRGPGLARRGHADAGVGTGRPKDGPPTRRSQRLLERIHITGLGGGESQLTPEDVAQVFIQARDGMLDCLEANDIPRSEFRAARGEDRRMVFEVDAEGQVRPDSIAVEPPFPEGLDTCHAAGFASARTAAAGGEGARVEVDMPSLRSRLQAAEEGRPLRRRLLGR